MSNFLNFINRKPLSWHFLWIKSHSALQGRRVLRIQSCKLYGGVKKPHVRTASQNLSITEATRTWNEYANDFEIVRGRRLQMKWQATGVMSFSSNSIRIFCWLLQGIASLFPLTSFVVISLFFQIVLLPFFCETFFCYSNTATAMVIFVGYASSHFIIKLLSIFAVFGPTFFFSSSFVMTVNATPSIWTGRNGEGHILFIKF